MAASPPNAAALNALIFDWGRKRADYDDQENRYRIDYSSAIDKMRRDYEDVEERNRTGFSDRGMLHSGASIKNQLELKEDQTRNQQEVTQGLNTNLATLARRRLENDQELEIQKTLALLGLTQDTSK